MKYNPEEPTALKAGEMLLRIGALLGAGALCIAAMYRFLECVPQSNWFSVFGPAVFTVFAVIFAGRIIVWGMLGAYVSAIPSGIIRNILRLALCGLVVLAFSTTASVFSPLVLEISPQVCPSYTLFNLL
ncbi:MAG: hypothetical protein RID11_12100 [Roseovarius sp.]|jgi:hypothetical protein|uniref:hypothetical protein n=1 Tax=Roseovarius sp. TaxID=1486281 RepID=UPI0032ECE2DA